MVIRWGKSGLRQVEDNNFAPCSTPVSSPYFLFFTKLVLESRCLWIIVSFGKRPDLWATIIVTREMFVREIEESMDLQFIRKGVDGYGLKNQIVQALTIYFSRLVRKTKPILNSRRKEKVQVCNEEIVVELKYHDMWMESTKG
jgi:hypothetical protein